MARSARAFVLRNTKLRPVPGLENLRLHLADEVLPLWHAVQVETADPDAAMPYWAFAWSGGLALAHYVRDHPETVAGRDILDLASGSGLCAIVAGQAGARSVAASDIDAFAADAIALNARANRQRVAVIGHDILDDDPPDVDVILAGDVAYDAGFADRAFGWLHRARAAGIEVLVGDPGRRYLPVDDLLELAMYQVRTTTELEDLENKRGWVYALRAGNPGSRDKAADPAVSR